MSQSTRTAYDDVVDLDTFPIHALGSDRARELVTACRAQLADDGVCVLPDFITAPAVAEMAELAGALAGKVWTSGQTHTVYFEPVDLEVPTTHPRAHSVRSAKHGIAYDSSPPMRRCAACTRATT